MPLITGQVREVAARDLEVIGNLHELRIAGKHLRYALEVFSPCFGAGLRPIYDQVAAIQEHLGGLNDCSEVAARLRGYAQDPGEAEAAGLAGLAACFSRREQEEAADFLTTWRSGRWSSLVDDVDRMVEDTVGPTATP